MKITCTIVHMIYNYLSLEKVRLIKECGRITYSKSMPHPSRTMIYHDLAYVAKGNFHLCQGDEKIIAEEGDVFFLTGNNYHFSHINSPEGSECVFFHFNIDEKDYITNELPSSPNEEYVCIPMEISSFDNPKIKQLFEEILNYFYKDNIFAKKMCNSLLLQLLVELEASVFNPTSFLGDEIVDRILDVLNENKNRNVTVDELSKKLSFSSRTLHLHFKKSMGVSIHQYQLNLKLNSAAVLLRYYPLITLKEIATMYGFFDEFHFSKSFKNKFAIAPQKYRLR